MARADLFPADRGLQTRIAIAAIGTPVFVAACLVALALTLPGKILGGLGGVLLLGLLFALSARRCVEDARPLSAEEEPELHAALERLCVLGDLPKPEVVLDDERQPTAG
jgi:heat shock protein HtpX